MSLNKVILIGRLGADPEIRYTLDGKPVASFRIATNEVIIKNGEKEIHTEWHRIVAFGRLAEICGEYLNKGTQVYIEGKLRTRKYEDKQGIVRYVTEIFADNMKILGKKSENITNKFSSENLSSSSFSKTSEDITLEPVEEPKLEKDSIDEDDIPF
ncbi:MAG: single-stranded DNA-binding protein [Thermodesulfobacteriota bacterium]|nr:MAG: single-stranded DNA-binding protein [Thermodesulfobacteriota bacterium]RLG11690.1 MAG: single-stranded DNA-binding protein [Candidatus Pacearchaeota archaeon]